MSAYAAPGRAVEGVRKVLSVDTKKAREDKANALVSDKAGAKEIRAKSIAAIEAATKMTGIGASLEAVMKQTVEVDGKQVAVAEIMVSVLEANKVITQLESAKDLTAADKADIKSVKEATATLGAALLLLSGVKDMNSTAAQAIKKQIGLIPEILKMESAERDSHIDIIRLAVAEIQSTGGKNIQGDEALKRAITKFYEGKVKESEMEAFVNKKLEELLGCKV